MNTFESRFDVLNDFEKSMRSLLRQRVTVDKTVFHRDMLTVIKYVSSVKDGVFLAQEIKTSFEFFLPLIENEWKNAVYVPLITSTEKYAEKLARQLENQQTLFTEVSAIISSLDMADGVDMIKSTIKSTLVPITLEFKLIKILCNIHHVLFQRDQEKLEQAIEEFLLEFKQLNDQTSQPLLQLRGLVEQIKVVIEMPEEVQLVKRLLLKVVDIAQTFIHSFCGE